MSDSKSPSFSFYPAIPTPAKLPLLVTPEHPCSYLPGRFSQVRAFFGSSVAPEAYHQLMDAGFRRSGDFFYQPICRGCRACTPARVPVARFVPTKSQRRILRRNQDLRMEVAPPLATGEKWDLYQRYVAARHDPSKEETREQFESFLYNSPVETVEITYRTDAGELLAAGICDLSHHSISTVYFYFNPTASSRSLGTFSALIEINLARKMNIPHYYLGYWIQDCAKMNYKSHFRPLELLGTDGIWREAAAALPQARE